MHACLRCELPWGCWPVASTALLQHGTGAFLQANTRCLPLNTLRPACLCLPLCPCPHPAVAKELCKRGYSRVFVITGGCQAWIAARLRTKQWFNGQALLAENVEKPPAAAAAAAAAPAKPVAPPAQLLVKEELAEEFVDA